MEQLEGHVAQYISYLAHPNYDYSEIKARIEAAETLVDRAVQCILEYLRYHPASMQCINIIPAFMNVPEVVDALKAWRNEHNQSIVDVPSDVLFYKHVIRIIEPDKFQKHFKDHFFNPKCGRPTDIYSIASLLDFDQEDKLKLEEIWKEINNESYYAFSRDRVICEMWLRAAKKFPASNDVVIATQIMIKELDKRYPDIHPIVYDLLETFPNMDVNTIVSNVKNWPNPFANLTRKFIRKDTIPSWLFKGILGLPTVDDCNYNWIQKQEAKEKEGRSASLTNEEASEFDLKALPNDVVHYIIRNNNEWIRNQLAKQNEETTSAFKFDLQALPEDLIYYIIPHLRYKQVIMLSLTNKRFFKLVNEDQHVWRQTSKRYFTSISVTNASDFYSKYRSKFQTGKLLHQSFMTYVPLGGSPASIELNGDKVILSQPSKIEILETHRLDKPQMRNHFRKKKLRVFPVERAMNRSTRLYNNKIFTHAMHGVREYSISVINTETGSQESMAQCSLDLMDDHLYFTIDNKSLLGRGFSMDLTTQQITKIDWTAELYKWSINGDILYGLQRVNYLEANESLQLKLFDRRISEKIVVELNCRDLRCFNVKDNDIYTVSSHIMQWDKRYLSHPVRKSTDPYYQSVSNKNEAKGEPAIDLTAMRVIGPDQMWDLTDFTWELAQLPREKCYITTNGILVAYSVDGAINIRQSTCSVNLSNKISTSPELRCNIF